MPGHSLPRIVSIAFAAVAVAAIVRTFFFVAFNETIPYTPFYPAIVIATMYGRLRGGFLAIGLSAFAASIWLAPLGKPLIEEATDLIGMLLFIGVGILVVGLCEQMRRYQERAETAVLEQQRLLQMEQQARAEAEDANRLKDLFVASVSHELRTPLQAILGWTELLSDASVDDETRTRGLDVINRNAKTQSCLIEDLLDMSRISAGKMRLSVSLINPRQAVEAAIQTVTLAAQAKGIRIIRSFDERAYAIGADPDRLQQIVWNLLSNAIKFSPRDSSIEVMLSKTTDGIEVKVVDQGQGITAEFLPLVFEQFRQGDASKTTRQAGLGLGLAIVKHLVELHGGTIRAESPGEGLGTTMIVSLPDGLTSTANAVKPYATEGQLHGLRILMVDDDPETCELVCRLLTEQQAEVMTATRAGDALNLAEQQPPDVIISDLAMPDLDGYELLRRLRRQPGSRSAPAMALTAYSSQEDRCRAFEAGYELHLTKPVGARRLTEAVAELASAKGRAPK
jgi:signal transduction histidine kinase/ActR/RegA family two-component response regulator